MQSLYAVESMSGEWKEGEPLEILKKKFDQSHNLLVYLVYFITELARFSETSAHQRASKNLPTAEDLTVNTKIAGNELQWKILEDEGFKQAIARSKPENVIDRDLVKKIYSQLIELPEYKEYTESPSRDKLNEKEIIQLIGRDLLLGNELFTSHIEDNFINWDDDEEMMHQLLNSYLQKPTPGFFTEFISAEKMDFAITLQKTVIEKKEFCLDMIRPKLKNWEADRIAALDMIIIRMGICEFLYFETIPPKVTINEYIDLAKDYSTPQSGNFVNGILDNIHKELLAENKIIKRSFRNSTL